MNKSEENVHEVYLHHGKNVVVNTNNKGRHRENCLCWQGCTKFKPNGPRSENCPIANAVFKNCVKFNIVSPVWECPEMEPYEIPFIFSTKKKTEKTEVKKRKTRDVKKSGVTTTLQLPDGHRVVTDNLTAYLLEYWPQGSEREDRTFYERLRSEFKSKNKYEACSEKRKEDHKTRPYIVNQIKPKKKGGELKFYEQGSVYGSKLNSKKAKAAAKLTATLIKKPEKKKSVLKPKVKAKTKKVESGYSPRLEPTEIEPTKVEVKPSALNKLVGNLIRRFI